MSDSSTPAFRLGSHEFGFSVLDSRHRYQAGSFDARHAGTLELDAAVVAAVGVFRRLASQFRGELTIFDGDRLVVAEEPRATSDPARPADGILRLRFKTTSYFAGALCRAMPTAEFARYLDSHWPPGVPTVAEIRDLVRDAAGFHPLRNPGTGVSICPVAVDGSGTAWTVLHRRGTSVAVNPGMWSTAVDEGFNLADIGADGRLDPWATAQRGAREELGIDFAEVNLFSFGLDPAFTPGGPASTGCGYVFSGWGTAEVTAGELASLSPAGSDAFEADASLIVKLTPDGVAAALSAIKPGQVTGTALFGLLGTLDRIRPGAAAAAARLLPAFWN